MINATIDKFGYPATLVAEYRHWVVLVRPAAATLGALVLAAKSDAEAYGDLSAEAFAEQALVVARIETALALLVGYEKINYLMLMMVDPHVHFHVVPRYEGSRGFFGSEYLDVGWPGMPVLAGAPALDEATIAGMVEKLRECGLT